MTLDKGLVQALTIWLRFCCESGALLLVAAGAAVPVAGPTPLTTAVDVGVGSAPFGPTLALRGPAGLGGGMFADIVSCCHGPTTAYDAR